MTASLLSFAAARFLTLRTRLTPQECVRRLEGSTLPWSASILVIPLVTSTLPLIGWVSLTGFAVRKRMLYGNGMQPEAKARFRLAPDGTRMTVRLGTRRWVKVTNVLGTTFMIFVGGLVAVLCRNAGDPRCSGPSVWTVPFAMPLFLMGLLLFARWLARDQSAFLIDLLKRMLEAEEVPSIPEAPR